jgi:hypothetical protein
MNKGFKHNETDILQPDYNDIKEGLNIICYFWKIKQKKLEAVKQEL